MKLPRYYDAMTTDERREAREEYAHRQDGACWFCGHPLAEKSPLELKRVDVNWFRFPSKFLAYQVHLQHDHKTGLTEGAIHAYCNAVSFDYIERPLTSPVPEKPTEAKP